MAVARFTGKFDNLLREFSHLRGFHQTLRSVVEQGAQSRKELKELHRALLCVLLCLQDAQLVHLDLKPACLGGRWRSTTRLKSN